MINKIEIEGYKSIKELSIDLRNVNVLIGSNGVGKSNFISFLKLLNTLYDQRLENYSLKYGADNILHFGRKKTKSIWARLTINHSASFDFELSPTIDDKLFVLGEKIVEDNSTGMLYLKSSNNNLRDDIPRNFRESEIKNLIPGVAIDVINCLKSIRVYHFHDTTEFAELRSASDVNDNYYLKENGSNLPSFLYYLQQKHPTNFKRIEKSIQSIAPFFENFQLEPQRLNTQKIQLEWTEKNHSESYFNASHLSDGTLRFIALATLLLQPSPPELIIIDEPELGLHPVAINKLAGMLRSAEGKKCQIIISTQSVGLVNNFQPEEIITVDRLGDETVFARLDTIQLQQWLDEYSIGDLWSKSIIKGQP